MERQEAVRRRENRSADQTRQLKSTCKKKKAAGATDLLLGAADVLHLRDQGRLALVQRSLQLLKRPGDLDHRLHLPLVELPGDLRHQLDGGRQLREPAEPSFTVTTTTKKEPSLYTDNEQVFLSTSNFSGCRFTDLWIYVIVLYVFAFAH